MHKKNSMPNVTSVVILTSDSGRRKSCFHSVQRNVSADSAMVMMGTRAYVQKRAAPVKAALADRIAQPSLREPVDENAEDTDRQRVLDVLGQQKRGRLPA